MATRFDVVSCCHLVDVADVCVCVCVTQTLASLRGFDDDSDMDEEVDDVVADECRLVFCLDVLLLLLLLACGQVTSSPTHVHCLL